MSGRPHSFPYIQTDVFYRPIIPLALRHAERLVDTYAFVDSGADISIFSAEFASMLDIDLTKLKKHTFSGVKGGEEGKGVGYISRLEIGMEDTFLTLPVILSFDTTLDTDMGILGQVGLFDNFLVQFDRANKTVVLK